MHRRTFLSRLMFALTIGAPSFVNAAIQDNSDLITSASPKASDFESPHQTASYDLNQLVSWQQKSIQGDILQPVFLHSHLDPSLAAFRLLESLLPTIDPDKPILLKPNIGGFNWFKNGVDNGVLGRVTDIRFVEGVINYLEKLNAKQIIIAEGWGVEKPHLVQRLFETAGYQALCDRHPNTRMLDLNYYGGAGPNDHDTIPVRIDAYADSMYDTGLSAPKIYLEHLQDGLVINIPKLKCHRFAVVSAGMKNLMGVIGFSDVDLPHTQKWRLHAELKPFLKQRSQYHAQNRKERYQEICSIFAERLCDIYQILKPHLTLIDGILAADGDGFNRSSSVPLGLAIGSKNTVYADWLAAVTTGYWDNTELNHTLGFSAPPNLLAANKKFYPGLDFSKVVEVKGNSIPDRELIFGLETMLPASIQGNAADQLAGGTTVKAIHTSAQFSAAGHQKLTEDRTSENILWITRDWKGNLLPHGVSTGFICRYTDQDLIFQFLSYYRQLPKTEEVLHDTDTPALFKRDVIEIFLDPEPKSANKYLEFEYSPGGNFLDLSVDRARGQYKVDWNSGMKGWTNLDRDKKIWHATLKIPLARLGKPIKGERWRLNIYRTEGKGNDRLYMAWQPTGTPKPNFHVPSAFGWLEFS